MNIILHLSVHGIKLKKSLRTITIMFCRKEVLYFSIYMNIDCFKENNTHSHTHEGFILGFKWKFKFIFTIYLPDSIRTLTIASLCITVLI